MEKTSGSDMKVERATDEKALILAKLLASMVCGVVDHPKLVSVSVERTSHKVVLILETAPKDAGMVIGGRGRTISAMRDVLFAAARSRGVMVDIDYVNDESCRQQL